MRQKHLMHIAVLGTVFVAATTALPAQVVRGVVRSQTSSRAIDGARVSANDREGRTVGEAIADDQGRFTLRVDAKGAPFSMTVRRIGIEPSTTQEVVLTAKDTVEFEFLIPETPVSTDTVRVTGQKSLNDQRFDDAKRHGWKVFDPEEVKLHRDRVNNVYDLLRWAGASSLIIPNRPVDCVRSSRYLAGDRRNDRCMVWIVDGQVLGPTPIMNPADVYFMAILNASESAVQFGERAPWGAIVVWTRMNGDRVKP